MSSSTTLFSGTEAHPCSPRPGGASGRFRSAPRHGPLAPHPQPSGRDPAQSTWGPPSGSCHSLLQPPISPCGRPKHETEGSFAGTRSDGSQNLNCRSRSLFEAYTVAEALQPAQGFCSFSESSYDPQRKLLATAIYALISCS